MPQPLVSARNLVKSFSLRSKHDTPVLKGLTIDIAEGEFTALVGASGAGKSTLLHLLGTLDLADEGSVEFFLDGERQDVKSLSPEQLARLRSRHLGFVFQFHHLLPEFDAAENVMMPALIAGEGMRETRKRALELLELVGLGSRSHHRPNELSGGEQQRVAIARALVNRPKIIFADEPTGNLDSANAESVLGIIRALREREGAAFVVATHSSDVARVAERVVRIADGRLLSDQRGQAAPGAG